MREARSFDSGRVKSTMAAAASNFGNRTKEKNKNTRLLATSFVVVVALFCIFVKGEFSVFFIAAVQAA